MSLSLNDIRLLYFIFLLIIFFFINNFFFFFLVLHLVEAYRVDRESDSERIWETMDGAKLTKTNITKNEVNVSVDLEENDYQEQDVDTYLDEEITNSEDYLWWNCNFRFEHFKGTTLISGEEHLILKDKLTGIYKYLKKRNKYEEDFLSYHASDYLKRKYHKKEFYDNITTLNLDIARDVANVKFFSKYKFLKYNQKFNYKKNK